MTSLLVANNPDTHHDTLSGKKGSSAVMAGLRSFLGEEGYETFARLTDKYRYEAMRILALGRKINPELEAVYSSLSKEVRERVDRFTERKRDVVLERSTKVSQTRDKRDTL